MSSVLSLKGAMMIAKEKHANQIYRGGSGSYFNNHITAVVNKVKEACNKAYVLTAAALHDIVEDTDMKLEQVDKLFGNQVKDLVWRLTDEQGGNRKERKEKTYPKIKADKYAVLIKLADRYINTHGSEKVDMYKKEFPDFKKSLYTPGVWEKQWKELEAISI